MSDMLRENVTYAQSDVAVDLTVRIGGDIPLTDDGFLDVDTSDEPANSPLSALKRVISAID